MKAMLTWIAPLLLVDCATTPIDTNTARSIPSRRIYAPKLVVPGEGKAELVVA